MSAVIQLARFIVGTSHILHQRHIVVASKFLHTIVVHLDGRYILLLLHINMRDIHPYIPEVSGCLTNLSEDIPSLLDCSLLCQDATFKSQKRQYAFSPYTYTAQIRVPILCVAVQNGTLKRETFHCCTIDV